MKRIAKKPLALTAQTLRTLRATELDAVGGAGARGSVGNVIQANTCATSYCYTNFC
ncbi:MAG: hypothetical protein K8W52_26450 [Deltaproteobacteria bacterium]|nr:hypothetical protein [Deltaproteobacteria bacterium]